MTRTLANSIFAEMALALRKNKVDISNDVAYNTLIAIRDRFNNVFDNLDRIDKEVKEVE